MAITTTQPTVIPPTSQVDCDKLWAEQIVIAAPIDGSPATAYVVTRPYYQDEGGNRTYAAANMQRTYTVPNLDAATAASTDISTAYAAVLAAVQVVVTTAEQQQQGA